MKAYAFHSRRKIDGSRSTGNVIVGRRAVRDDPRWPRIAAQLAELRDRGRRAVRIVDADCGAGWLLIEALAFARSIGFTAVEGRGIDGSPAMIARARAAQKRLDDPGIGLRFELSDAVAALGEEIGFPADIILWHRAETGSHDWQMTNALTAAGRIVIGDSGADVVKPRTV